MRETPILGEERDELLEKLERIKEHTRHIEAKVRMASFTDPRDERQAGLLWRTGALQRHANSLYRRMAELGMI